MQRKLLQILLTRIVLMRWVKMIVMTAALGLAALSSAQVNAQSIETDLTSHNIIVDIGFSGASITLFGTTVDRPGRPSPGKTGRRCGDRRSGADPAIAEEIACRRYLAK